MTSGERNSPSPVIVTKKCKVNGTTQNSNIELSNIGILGEDIVNFILRHLFCYRCRMDIQLSLTSSEVLPPHSSELISPEKHSLITYDEQQTHRTLAVLGVLLLISNHMSN
jgi:hypothetical protein